MICNIDGYDNDEITMIIVYKTNDFSSLLIEEDDVAIMSVPWFSLYQL
jgi:hypothetical protein